MNQLSYIKLSSQQIDKVGNAIVYLSEKLGQLSKTKVLKLIYILDEMSIKRNGIPFFNLKYKVWKFGPVSEEIFIDLSSETMLLKKYIGRVAEDGITSIIPNVKFDDSEFSDNDMLLMDEVIQIFGNKSAKELVEFTHRINAPWHQTAKEHGVLDLLENEEINNTELLVDMSSIVAHDDRKKHLYLAYLEQYG